MVPPSSRLQAKAMNATTEHPGTADHPQSHDPQSDATQSEYPQSGQPRGSQVPPMSQPYADSGFLAPGQPLRRPVQGRMLAGVAAGIAEYLRIDVTLVRIVLAVLTVVGGAGVPIYLAGWLLIPEEGRERSIAGEFIESRQAR
jgi:phage shock protein PspC (stress-responsive transcriptional regulator)